MLVAFAHFAVLFGIDDGVRLVGCSDHALPLLLTRHFPGRRPVLQCNLSGAEPCLTVRTFAYNAQTIPLVTLKVTAAHPAGERAVAGDDRARAGLGRGRLLGAHDRGEG